MKIFKIFSFKSLKISHKSSHFIDFKDLVRLNFVSNLFCCLSCFFYSKFLFYFFPYHVKHLKIAKLWITRGFEAAFILSHRVEVWKAWVIHACFDKNKYFVEKTERKNILLEWRWRLIGFFWRILEVWNLKRTFQAEIPINWKYSRSSNHSTKPSRTKNREQNSPLNTSKLKRFSPKSRKILREHWKNTKENEKIGFSSNACFLLSSFSTWKEFHQINFNSSFSQISPSLTWRTMITVD